MMKTNEEIVALLKLIETKDDDMSGLLKFMKDHNYYSSPASTRYHRCYKGGLVGHNLGVYRLFRRECICLKLQEKVPERTVIICSLLHDICKSGAYTDAGNNKFQYNKTHPKGHGELSINIISKFIKLTQLEEKIIRFHMGIYSTKELNPYGEYTLMELKKAWDEPVLKLFHWCDDLESQFC